MQKHKTIIIALLVAVIISGALLSNMKLRQSAVRQSSNASLSQLSQLPDRSKAHLSAPHGNVLVEVVNSPASITQGLSGRSELGSDGMLFVLPQRLVPRFWMKEMRFDLDLIWIDGDRIVDRTLAVPAPDSQTPLNQLPTYSPKQPVTMVLEVPAGQAEARDLRQGLTLSIVLK